MTITNSQFIRAMQEMITERIERGLKPWLITIMFKPLRCSQTRALRLMTSEIERIYSRHVTRAIRNPNGFFSKHKRPIWIAMPDLPVFKHEKILRSDVFVNGGLHYHTFALMPYECRFKEPLDIHFSMNAHVYLGPSSFFDRIDVKAIDRTPEQVVDYLLKSISSRRMNITDMLLLPKSESEL